MGILANKFKNTALILPIVCLVAASISCACFPFCTQYTTFVILGLIYGLVIGPVCTLAPESLIEMFGIDLLKDSFGLMMIAYGIGSAIGSPIGGVIYSIEMNYNNVFYFCGITYLIASIICCFVLCLNKTSEC